MKHLLVFLFLLCSASVSAQDVIVKKDGSTILSKVIEVGQEEIKYKKFDHLEGPTYTIQKSELLSINYQNGAKDTFSAPLRDDNRYLPNNQNDGVQQYNDRALLGMDYANQKIEKRVKNLRIWGWVSGIAGVGLGTLFINLSYNSDGQVYHDRHKYRTVGGVLAAGGIATATYCFVSAHKKQKQAEMSLQSSLLYHYNYKFDNGSSLSAGIDMISDRTNGNNAFGLGLRYNF